MAAVVKMTNQVNLVPSPWRRTLDLSLFLLPLIYHCSHFLPATLSLIPHLFSPWLYDKGHTHFTAWLYYYSIVFLVNYVCFCVGKTAVVEERDRAFIKLQRITRVT